jgi:serine/threonine protein kinase
MIRDRVNSAEEYTAEWSPRGGNEAAQASPVIAASVGDPVTRIVAGRYRLRTLLGAGGMGAVWLAQDEVLRRVVALKQTTSAQPPESSLLEEARAAARVTHPGVVRVHDLLADDDGDWIVMEALQGKPLSTVMRERGRLPVDEVVPIALQLLSALEAIHAVGLVHRDVKPSNVHLCDGDRVVLTDFGLSSPSGVWGGASAGTVYGSLPYLAPESLIEGVYGPASDLYAFGVTLYRAVEGRRPFHPGTPWTLLECAPRRAPKPARHAGPMREVLEGLLQNDPARRTDAAGVRDQLQAISRATQNTHTATSPDLDPDPHSWADSTLSEEGRKALRERMTVA